MKKILVPTDFSVQALYAAQVAVSIAKKSGATLHFVHVIDLPSYADSPSFRLISESSELKQKAEKAMQDLLDELNTDDLDVNSSIEFDTIYQSIIDISKTENIDLIVIGSHGTSGIEKFLIGSVTEKVIQMAPCLVLAIKYPIDDIDIKSMVFASSFYGEVCESYPKIQRFANLFGAKIHLLKVLTRHHFETTRYSKKIIEAFIKECHAENYTINTYNDDTEEEGMLHFAEDINADLIALATHGRTGLSHLINGSITEHLTDQSPKPVLCYKTKHVKLKYGIIGPYSR
jgi:nucleotide-binding universal stress UspA family protein